MCELSGRSAVIVDPFPLWLEAVESVLGRVGIAISGKSTTQPGALGLVAAHEPDLLVTEADVPEAGFDGIGCLRKARELNPSLRVVVVSRDGSREHVDATLAAGASAYVMKSAHPDDLASAVRQAFESSVYLAPGDAGSMPDSTTHEAMPIAPPVSVELTKRELEILRLVAEGYSNAQLARMLWVTEQTVKFHLSNVYRKLDVSNRTEAARWAQIHGVLGPPSNADLTAA